MLMTSVSFSVMWRSVRSQTPQDEEQSKPLL